ncbi:putative uncharacterized protein isoform A [Chlorella sorokiniana]|uniref:Uncharacterized protein n=1 Tax=Chlorella sorokiniana TaxID=3076 RepID=A0A2P6THV5_CHLSO|nr:putative uncharacterized protein isoform B [Chlorella sorokiniana]PRW33860.1 putative uncharacterized protein isoform A [Chlorella sorokiniana]|eukprot:PRW33859.1 putative uncharacterized protein isoform B [Chlorella sorokiniana]
MAAVQIHQGASADGELPLWRFLRQCGFSEVGIGRMRGAVRPGKSRYKVVTGRRYSQQKVAQDLAPNIAALLGEGLDTPAIERLFTAQPNLLTATHSKFASSLAALRQLADLLPDDPRSAQAPSGATQLGLAILRRPGSVARLLQRGAPARLIGGNLRLRRQLGVSGSATAHAIFTNSAVLASDLQQAEALVAHLQRLQASGELSAAHVTQLALEPCGLSLSPAEFDRRRREGGDHALACIGLKDPNGRQQAIATALGELLQAAAGVPGPLQQQYRQQATAQAQRYAAFMRATPASLRANWAALHRAGLADGDIAAIVQQQPSVLTHNWGSDSKKQLATWLRQELGLSLAQFLKRHVGYANKGVGRLAMRAAYLQQHRPAVWQQYYARGAGPLLSLLSDNRNFYPKSGCTQADLAAFEREWLRTPAGRRWGGKPSRT